MPTRCPVLLNHSTTLTRVRTGDKFRFRKKNKLKYNINKWRFFIKAFNIHHKISMILLNSFYFWIHVTMFAYECLKSSYCKIYALYYVEFWIKCTGLQILCLMLAFLKWKFFFFFKLIYCILKGKVKVDSVQMRVYFSF